MKTASKIQIAYRVAKMVGREHADDLDSYEDGSIYEVKKIDRTGYQTSVWTIYVRKDALRQVVRFYDPATGEDFAISSHDAETIIILDKDPYETFRLSKSLRDYDRRNKIGRYAA